MRAAEASTICPGIVLVHVETISEGVEVSAFTDGEGIRLGGHSLATGCGCCDRQRALNSVAEQQDRRSLQLDCAFRPDRRTQKACLRRYRPMPRSSGRKLSQTVIPLTVHQGQASDEVLAVVQRSSARWAQL